MKKQFGHNQHGEPVTLYLLENDRFRIAVTDYGATLVSFIDKNRDLELVAGFDDVEHYVQHTAHFGSTIGRVANRIKDAKFDLNGRTYHVSANKGNNSLHGGAVGFDKRMFQGRVEDNRIVLTATSPDGEEGYPGNLQVQVTYRLDERGIHIECEGVSDQTTLFGTTNHSYFNLNGNGSIAGHRVQLFADAYAPNDETGTATGDLVLCENTPFDFRNEKEIGADFDSDDEQIRMTRGYDHHYSIQGSGLRTMAVCRANGLRLETRSNLPGIHFYTGNFLDGSYVGHRGVAYGYHERVCFEPEYYPNAINYETHEKPVLKAGEHAVQIIEYWLDDDKEEESSTF